MVALIRDITNLHDLLDYDARNLLSSELQLKQVIHDWTNKANAYKLKEVLSRYLVFVEKHVEMLNGFFKEERLFSPSAPSKVMQAMIGSCEEKLKHCADPEVSDACLLACIQEINHYKISRYGTATAFANALEMESFGTVFHEAEINEKQIDDRLSQLAEHDVNIRAKAPIALPGQ